MIEHPANPVTTGGEQFFSGWEPPESAAPYLEIIRDAEKRHGIPHNLLARLLYQESRFRRDIIEGDTVSDAGAVGIAQIVPRWHPDVDPLDPVESIYYAASYLRRLYNRFNSWKMALAGYNWGPTILAREGLDKAPAETRNYIAQITADVPVV